MNSMKLHRTLGTLLAVPPAYAGIAIGGLCSDSRSVQPGDAFIALRGVRHDGLEHLAEVHARGAVAVLVEAGRELPGSTPLPLVPVEAPTLHQPVETVLRVDPEDADLCVAFCVPSPLRIPARCLPRRPTIRCRRP